MGSIVIQADPRIRTDQIHTEGMVSVRGTQHSGFVEGHPVN